MGVPDILPRVDLQVRNTCGKTGFYPKTLYFGDDMQRQKKAALLPESGSNIFSYFIACPTTPGYYFKITSPLCNCMFLPQAQLSPHTFPSTAFVQQEH